MNENLRDFITNNLGALAERGKELSSLTNSIVEELVKKDPKMFGLTDEERKMLFERLGQSDLEHINLSDYEKIMIVANVHIGLSRRDMNSPYVDPELRAKYPQIFGE